MGVCCWGGGVGLVLVSLGVMFGWWLFVKGGLGGGVEVFCSGCGVGGAECCEIATRPLKNQTKHEWGRLP